MKNQRRKKLINRRVQIGISATFAGVALLAILLQALLFAGAMLQAAQKLPSESQQMVSQIPDTMIRTLLISVGVILPLTFLVGILTTFRIVGPMYRFEKFLREVASGTQREPCRIREGDFFQGFCTLLNQATEPLRAPQPAHSSEEPGAGQDSDAA